MDFVIPKCIIRGTHGSCHSSTISNSGTSFHELHMHSAALSMLPQALVAICQLCVRGPRPSPPPCTLAIFILFHLNGKLAKAHQAAYSTAGWNPLGHGLGRGCVRRQTAQALATEIPGRAGSFLEAPRYYRKQPKASIMDIMCLSTLGNTRMRRRVRAAQGPRGTQQCNGGNMGFRHTAVCLHNSAL